MVPKLTEQSAITRLKVGSFEPLAPGTFEGVNKIWAVRCTSCQSVDHVRLTAVEQGRRCQSCSKQKSRVPVTAEEAARVMRAAGFEPSGPFPGTAGAAWECACTVCGRTSRPNVSKVRGGHRCPHTDSGRPRVPAAQAVAELLAAGAVPLVPYTSSNTPWDAICLTCHEPTSPRLDNIRSEQGACRRCGHQRRADKMRIPHVEAVARMREANLRPLENYPGMNSPWRSECLVCGEQVSPHYGNIVSGQGGCKPCSLRAQAERQRTPADRAREDMLAHMFEPLEEYPGNTKLPWRCLCMTCGESSSPSLHTVRADDSQCKFCAAKAGGAKRRLTDTQARTELLSFGFEAIVDYPGYVHARWPSTCIQCSGEVSPTLVDLRAGGGCRICGPRGFQYTQPAVLYLITHDELMAHKVGITSKVARRDRLSAHAAHGWRVAKTFDVTSGKIAYEAEQSILRWIRDDLGFGACVAREQMPQRGYTETVSVSDIALEELAHAATSHIANAELGRPAGA